MKAFAQESYAKRFLEHNSAMAGLEPSFPTPLVEADPRLAQYYRLSFSHEYAPQGTETTNYGNNRGIGMIALNRFELDFVPPSYVQHNSSAVDGRGDIAAGGKFRIVSGNAEHGNYILTALVNHTFATGSASNGALTDTWSPTLAGAKGFGKHYDAESALGGTLPTGKIAAQGRSISWNSLLHDHLAPNIWLEFENNATYFRGGPHSGKMQNFVTPAVFYVYRSSDWRPAHPFLVFTSGMQIAVSGFHNYNHNLVSEVRLLF